MNDLRTQTSPIGRTRGVDFVAAQHAMLGQIHPQPVPHTPDPRHVP